MLPNLNRLTDRSRPIPVHRLAVLAALTALAFVMPGRPAQAEEGGATQVTIGGVPSSKITVDSPTQITALVRSIADTGPITVTTMRGTAVFTVTKHY